AIAEHSGELLYKHDLNHRFTYLSPQFQTFLGYGTEDQQMQWQQLLTDSPLNACAQRLTDQAIRTGVRQAPYLVEARKKDGSAVLMEVDESPLKDATGQVVAIVGAARDVTEREKAQRALRQSEEKFRQLAETITEVFWMADLAFEQVTYVSPAYQQIWGRSPESLYQNPRSWFQAVHPEDREHAWATFMRSRGAQEASAEYRIVRPDGSVRWVLDRAFPLRNESGQSVGLVGLAKDITESKLAEASLRESEQLYRAIFEAASDGILILEGGRFIDCNQRTLEIYGATRAQLLGKTAVEWSPARQPDGQLSAEKADQIVARVAAGEPQCFHWQHLRQDGTNFMVEVSLRRFTLGPKMLLLALTRDITGRLQAEEALRESESKLRGLYTSMNEGLALHEMIYDVSAEAVDYRVLDVNPAFEIITGLTREKVLGMQATAVYGTPEAPFLAVYAQVAASGEPTAFETFFGPIGKHFAVSVFSPRKGQFATVFSDISKRKEAERQICLLNQVYALISHINEAIVRIADRETLFREACRITVEDGQFPMAWVGLLDETTRQIAPAAWAGREEGYLAKVRMTADTSPEGMGPTGAAIREGRVVICGDIEQDPRMAPWREAALARGYRSLIALPLQVGGRNIGAFVVYAGETDFFNAIVTESLIEVAADISFALDLFERNRQRELEQQQLRLQHSALEAAANAILIARRDGTIEWVNAAFTRLTGYSRDEAIGRKPNLLKSGAHNPAVYQTLWNTVLTGSVWQGALTNKRKDGTLYDEETTITPVYSGTGEVT
ncbi:MAG TPA: PAS domain S-box protein, partial [Candidatus Sulfotelmatobacter sp.]|nr:PAS domain S-box protein [Candidatus Sulfotelmatobacter sp.]